MKKLITFSLCMVISLLILTTCTGTDETTSTSGEASADEKSTDEESSAEVLVMEQEDETEMNRTLLDGAMDPNYYNFYICEDDEFVYITAMDIIYSMNKATQEWNTLYQAETGQIMGTTVIDGVLFFSEYTELSEGTIFKYDLVTGEKAVVIEDVVAYEIVRTEDRILFKTALLTVEEYLYNEDGTVGDYIESGEYTNYIYEYADGRTIQNTYRDEGSTNVTLVNSAGEEEGVLFDTQDALMVVPEGVYHYKNEQLEFYNYNTKQSEKFCGFLDYFSNPLETFDDNYIYGHQIIDNEVLQVIRWNRSNGEAEILFETNKDEATIATISVYQQVLYLSFEVFEGEEGVFRVLNPETKEMVSMEEFIEIQ